jgi:hypothetical protein
MSVELTKQDFDQVIFLTDENGEDLGNVSGEHLQYLGLAAAELQDGTWFPLGGDEEAMLSGQSFPVGMDGEYQMCVNHTALFEDEKFFVAKATMVFNDEMEGVISLRMAETNHQIGLERAKHASNLLKGKFYWNPEPILGEEGRAGKFELYVLLPTEQTIEHFRGATSFHDALEALFYDVEAALGVDPV